MESKQDDSWGVLEVGLFQDGGKDGTGLTVVLDAADAATLVLVHLANPDWLPWALTKLCQAARKQVDEIGPQNIPPANLEMWQWEGGMRARAKPAPLPH